MIPSLRQQFSSAWSLIRVCVLISGPLWVLFGQSVQKAAVPEQDRLTRHAILFPEFALGTPVDQRSPNSNGQIDLSGGMLYEYADDRSGQNYSAPPLLRNLAGRSSLIVRATAELYRSALTNDRTFLYSDWLFRVHRVFKNTSKLGLNEHEAVSVVRTGGHLLWNGRVVFAHDTAFPDFVAGKEYVLYLLDIPGDSESFRATDWGSFLLQADGVHSLLDERNTADALRTLVRSMPVDQFVTKVQENRQ